MARHQAETTHFVQISQGKHDVARHHAKALWMGADSYRQIEMEAAWRVKVFTSWDLAPLIHFWVSVSF